MLQYKEQYDEADSRAPHALVRKIKPSFALFVILPTLLSVIYFGFLASDVYISQSHFLVRTEKKEQSFGLGSLISGAASAGTSDEVYAVEDYMNSRDALRDLNRDKLVIDAYSRPSISAFDRFGSYFNGGATEDLYKYMQSRISASFEGSKSVTTLRVRAYTPEDAQRINIRLLALGEQLVNKLNERSRSDLVVYAQNEVNEAKENAARSAEALSEFRNRRGILDPEKQAEVQVQLISKLQDEMIATQTQLDQLRQFAPDNPQVPVLERRIASIRRQIGGETAKVTGGAQSFAGKAPGYERVALQNEFATKQLASALTSLEAAKNEARRQQIYIERIVNPNKPDKPLEPKRLRGILSTFILCLVLYGVFSLLFAGIKEHQA
ncbi:hypothetical protein ACQKE8_18350 [Sphingobium limneticum]|jgi:capsular polysaccharide transport system permease protein|uniref:hypothetical protein n=1 Tax=Sphingobium TaxID=165695 RepID=UPI003137A6F9